MSDELADPTSPYAALTIDELTAAFFAELVVSAAGLVRMSRIWSEMLNRGVKIDSFQSRFRRLLPHLSAIAAGTLAPEAVHEFRDRLPLLALLTGLPLSRQRELAQGAPVSVAAAAGQVTLVPLIRLPERAAAKVFIAGVECTPDEQRIGTSKARAGVKRRYKVSVNRDRGLLRVGNVDVHLAEVVAAMSQAAGHEGAIDEAIHANEQGPTATARLTNTEMERLKGAAKSHNLPIGELVRRAVIAMWML